jgi:hypothetical protein
MTKKDHFLYKHLVAHCCHGWYVFEDPSISIFPHAPNHDNDNLHLPSFR